MNMMFKELTDDQSKDAMRKVESMADGIIATATGLSGLDGLGLFAGNVKAVSLLFATVYALPILFLGIAVLYALWVKYPHDFQPEPSSAILFKKHKRSQLAALFLGLGILSLFVASLLYAARSLV